MSTDRTIKNIPVDGLNERIARLSPAKRALLELRLKKNAEGAGNGNAIARRANAGSVPLSFAQQRLWFLDQQEPGNSAYNRTSAARLSGPLNVAALELSFNEIVRRHEVLRTTFISDEGNPAQIIIASMKVDLPVIDLSELYENEREARARRLITEEGQHSFDLARGPLMRVTLLRLGAEEHILLLNMHHIITDGWSMGILFKELAALYDAFSGGRPSPLPELTTRYADYAVWQREWIKGEVHDTQLGYWKRQLEGAPVVLEMPTDRTRPAMQSFRGAVHSFVLSPSLSDQLKALSQQQGATLFMVLLAAFQVLLSRYTSQEDFVVGTPVANRNRTETEGLIGFFVNMLAMRANLSDDPSFCELVGRVREVALGAYEHQDVPFEAVVEALQPARSLSHSPLFQVMFILQNAPFEELELPGLPLTQIEFEYKTAKFDLTLSLVEEAEGIKGQLEYNTDLFDEATVGRMSGHYRTLLEGIVRNPNQRLSSLPLLTEAERHRLLVDWNATSADYPQDRCIHQLFEAQVERTPDTIAVVCEQKELTYRELNRRSNQLAHHLIKHGVGPETLVGIYVERSLEMVVGLLGILKAGGAYVPLDPEYPQQRRAFMLEDTSLPILLTQQRLVEKLPDLKISVVCIDSGWKKIARESDENPVSRSSSDNLAYVMYTSGSTGRPKGVEVCHRGIVRLLFGVDYARLDTTETFLSLAPISFDASTFEIWGALLHGARCVLCPQRIPTLEDLGFIIQKHGVSTLWLTASLFNTVIDEAPEALSGIRQLLIGGEALSVSHVHRALELLPSTQIINGYGPTESTTFTCCHRISHRFRKTVRSIPIGRPIGNTQVYLLDNHLNPVPIGIPGELYIGGVGLARGYLNRPELTAEQFIANPFSDEPGARLYKTGDMARYLPDGNIEFLGRNDQQVKIQGHRIELGEVEIVLAQHSSVRESVVLVREDASGNKHLVAYVVPNEDRISMTGQLRSYLKENLPDYMVPGPFLVLDELPLSPNGKVDLRALAALDQSRGENETVFVAPRDVLEFRLTKIWEDVIGTQPIGVTDNFFDVGGHSLLAVRLFAQIYKEFGKSIPLATVFREGTVEQQADLLRQEGQPASLTSLVAIQSGGSKRPIFFVSPTAVLNLVKLANCLGPDQPFYGLQSPGLEDGQPPFTRMEDLVAYYIKEIRGVQPEGPYILGGRCFGGIVAFEVAQQLHAHGEKTSLLVILDSGPPKKGRLNTRANNVTKKTPSHYARSLLYHLQRREFRQLLSNKIEDIAQKLKEAAKKKVDYLQESPQDRRLRRIQEANIRAKASYYAQVYPGRITLIQSTEFHAREDKSWHLKWSNLARGGFDSYVVEGSHQSMLEGQHVQFLAERLKACLDAATEIKSGR